MRNNPYAAPVPLKLVSTTVIEEGKPEIQDGGAVSPGDGLSAKERFEQFGEKRKHALQITPHQLKKIPVEERDELVYQYLTPDEIWQFKDALQRAYPAIARLDMSQMSVDSVGSEGTTSSEEGLKRRATLDHYKNYKANRREIMSWSDDTILAKKPEEIEAFYKYLTPDEILEMNEKLENLRRMNALSLSDK